MTPEPVPTTTRRIEKRKSRRRWIGLVIGAVFALLLAEGAVRIFALGPPTYQRRRIDPPEGIPLVEANGVWVYRANATFSYIFDPAGDHRGYFGPTGRVIYRINEHHMRGPVVDVDKSPAILRVVCLGDSFTFGEGVHYPDTYPARLERLLSAAHPDRPVEVLNAGVQSYGTDHAVAFHVAHGARFEPDIVTLGFFLNDATDARETVRHHGALIDPPELSPLARLSKLWGIFERRRHAARVRRAYFETTRRSFDTPQWQKCKDLLGGMQKWSDQDEFRFVVVIFPILWGLDGAYPFEDLHRRIRRACDDAGCEVIDLLDTYRGRSPQSLWIHPTDQHPNEIAHRLAAERIARHLVSKSDPADRK